GEKLQRCHHIGIMGFLALAGHRAAHKNQQRIFNHVQRIVAFLIVVELALLVKAQQTSGQIKFLHVVGDLKIVLAVIEDMKVFTKAIAIKEFVGVIKQNSFGI